MIVFEILVGAGPLKRVTNISRSVAGVIKFDGLSIINHPIFKGDGAQSGVKLHNIVDPTPSFVFGRRGRKGCSRYTRSIRRGGASGNQAGPEELEDYFLGLCLQLPRLVKENFEIKCNIKFWQKPGTGTRRSFSTEKENLEVKAFNVIVIEMTVGAHQEEEGLFSPS